MEDDSAFAYKNKKPASSWIFNLLFSYVGLFFVVAIYTTLGAMAFVSIERPNEERIFLKKRVAAKGINSTMNYMAQRMLYFSTLKNWTFADYSLNMTQDLEELEGSIMHAMDANNYDGTVDGWSDSWTFSNSLLFTMSIVTTIGYGNVVPITFYGQMFCIVYALIGCPLLLLFLTSIGEAMGNSFIYIYSRCCCRWCRSTRYKSELPPGSSKRNLKLLIDDEVGKEEYMPTAKVSVPIVICLVMLASYVVLGAVMFSQWEDWKFHSACYFTFITVATIGYGDYYPAKTMVQDMGADFVESFKMFIVILFLLFGMALLSTAVNLMQDQLMEKCRWLAREIGITKADPVKGDAKKAPVPGDPNVKALEAGQKQPDAPSTPAKNKRKESVAEISVPDSPRLTPSTCPTRPVSALSMLPGAAED